MFKLPHSLLNGFCQHLRENSTHISKRICPFHLRLYVSKRSADLIFAEIFQSLNRDFSASRSKGTFFELSLKFHSCKRMFTSVIFRSHRHDNGAVRIFSCSCMITHSVDSQTSFFGGCIDYISSRTHAERVYASSIFQFCCHFIRRCRKSRHRLCSILRGIDHFLRMLGAHTYRK